MHGRCRQQRRYGDAVGPDHAVREDDDVLPQADRQLGFAANPVQRRAHARCAGFGGIGDVDRLGAERVLLDVADLADALQFLVGEDRVRRLQPHRLRRALEVEDVGPGTDERDQTHDQFLADRVDRRVRDLREVLLEVGVQQLGLRRQRRDRRVRAHRAHGFLAGVRHRRHQELEALFGVAERLLAIEQTDVGLGCLGLDGGEVGDLDLRTVEPRLVGVARG